MDRAEIITPQVENGITRKLAALEARTTDQLIVVTLPSLGGQAIEDVGLRLGKSWGVGQKHKDNGVLFIVAPTERKVRIEVGYGLETALTNQWCGNVIQQVILPHFRTGDLEQGVVAGVQVLVNRLNEHAGAKLDEAA